ncbi:MAG TPA: hypothetical protein DDZ88_18920 [Verrucomicrobiales bacterium]|nr:hypothetical protein [Verrucomicrobiales bacterium]
MSLKATHASRLPMTRLSHEDWTRMNAMTLEIHRSSSEGELLDLTRRFVREVAGAGCELLTAQADPKPQPPHLAFGPWTLHPIQTLPDRSRAFLEILATHITCAWQRLHVRLLPLSARLSKRQREVLPLLLQGATNIEIAHALGISPRTVEKHVAAILRLNDCTNRSQLLAGRRDEMPSSA